MRPASCFWRPLQGPQHYDMDCTCVDTGANLLLSTAARRIEIGGFAVWREEFG